MIPIHHHPNLDPILKDKLLQLSREFFLVAIYHAPATTETIGQILIVAQFRKQVQTILERKWVRNSPEKDGVHILGVYDHQLQYHQKKGNPWVRFLCHTNFKIYDQKEYDTCYDTVWDSGKKKRKAYTNAFHHDRDLLITQAERCQEPQSIPSTVLAYEALFEHHISQLEALYVVTNYHTDTLHQRITRLLMPCPELQGLFVKQKNNGYVLPLQFENAKQEDPIGVNAELLPSIRQTEAALCQKVVERLDQLKIWMEPKMPTHTAAPLLSAEPQTLKLQLTAVIIKMAPVEEIYSFHNSNTTQGNIDFLLLVGEGLGRERLDNIRAVIRATLGDTQEVVLIGHTRSWIQKNLYQHQPFFKKAMAQENRWYQSHPHHPQLHWEEPYKPLHPELDERSQSAMKMMDNFLALRYASSGDCSEGLDMLFSTALLRLFRVLIYATANYLPNYLSSRTLWNLVLYGTPELEHLAFLFEKGYGQKAFSKIDGHLYFHQHSSQLNESQRDIMEEILDIVTKKVSEAVARVAQ